MVCTTDTPQKNHPDTDVATVNTTDSGFEVDTSGSAIGQEVESEIGGEEESNIEVDVLRPIYILLVLTLIVVRRSTTVIPATMTGAFALL